MNRSILIVICDFLLVSLLAFSTVDINKASDEGRDRTVQIEIATNQVVESGKDLAAVMRVALAEERKQRDILMGELAKTRQSATEQEKQALTTLQELQSQQKETERWQQQFALSQTNLQTLNAQLQSRASEALMSQERLAALEAELRKKSDQASTLQQQISDLSLSNQATLSEKQRLAGQLQVVEAEKRQVTEQVSRMQEEVKVERQEKAKLAEGVQALATRSGQLETEIRENRPQAPNTIFSEFMSNRVEAKFSAHRSGLIGTNKKRDTGTILINDGTNIFALCHVEETPLTFFNPGVNWEQLDGSLVHNSAQVPVKTVAFHFRDPRVVLIPLTAAEVKQLGAKVYRLSNTPFKFQDAVLIGANPADTYYGECKFEIDPSTPQYVRLDHSVIRGLFGKFNPSRGDLVFTKTGDFLGIMANSSYCLVIKSYEASAHLQFGSDVKTQNTGSLLSLLYDRVAGLPSRLQ